MYTYTVAYSCYQRFWPYLKMALRIIILYNYDWTPAFNKKMLVQ